MRAWVLGLLMLMPAVTVAQAAGLPAELKGTWLLINDKGQPSYIAFADDPMAIYRGKLSTVTLNNSKHHPDAAAEAAEIEKLLADDASNERVSDTAAEMFVDRLELPDIDDAAKAAGTDEVSAAFRERIGERLQLLLDRLQDAATKGDGTLTRLDLTFVAPSDYSDTAIERRADIAISGNRLYLLTNKRIWIFDRTSALTGEARAEWDRRGYRGFEMRANSEYSRLFSRCVSLQRDDRPVEECRAYRDRMANFGVELKPEFVLERHRDFDRPTETEVAFWKNQLPQAGTWSDTFPALDYCFDGHSTDETREAFTDRLAANKFQNTLWRLTTMSNAPGEKPRNWTQDEYMAWAPPSDRMLGEQQGLAFFRAGGVLGFGDRSEGLGFDPRNRWSYEDGEIRISWYDDTFEARIPIQRAGLMHGTTSFMLAKKIDLQLVLGNYDLLTKMAYPQSHPDYEYLLPFAQGHTCDSRAVSSRIAEKEVNREPEFDWPTRSPDAFPTHWFARTDMSDGTEHPDASTWEEMQRGGFYHLNETGIIGVSIERPAGYGYDKSARWKINGKTMAWTWSNWDTFVFELPDEYGTEISAIGQKNPQYRMVLTPADLLEPGTRSRAIVGAVREATPAPEPQLPVTPEAEPESVAAPTAEPEALVAPKAELPGCWKWSNGPKISLLADGTAINGFARGKWRAVDAGYEIEWPPIEDTLTLAGNGSSFDGIGLFGVRFSSTRIGAGDGLQGQWRRQDGVMLVFDADGTATVGPLRGSWSSKAGNSYTVYWTLTDSVSISADGDRLDIVNQFGKASARRDSGC